MTNVLSPSWYAALPALQQCRSSCPLDMLLLMAFHRGKKKKRVEPAFPRNCMGSRTIDIFNLWGLRLGSLTSLVELASWGPCVHRCWYTANRLLPLDFSILMTYFLSPWTVHHLPPSIEFHFQSELKGKPKLLSQSWIREPLFLSRESCEEMEKWTTKSCMYYIQGLWKILKVNACTGSCLDLHPY